MRGLAGARRLPGTLERMSNRIGATALLLALVTSGVLGQSHGSLDDWVAANTSLDEQLVCKRDINGEYFFVARAGPDRLRLGSRLDMTEYRDTHSFAVGWMLTNENGNFIVAKVTPTRLRHEYVTSGGQTYAESVEYQRIRLGSTELRVGVDIEKCPARQCETTGGQTAAKKYVIEVCATRL